MTQTDRIIAKFGGLTKLAKALGHRHPTTVQGWKERGYIPYSHHRAILEAGQDLPDPVRPEDFLIVPLSDGAAA